MKIAFVFQEKVRRELRHNALQSMVNFFCDFEDLPLRFEQASQLYYVTDTMISVSSEDNQTNGNGFDEVMFDYCKRNTNYEYL